MKWLLIVTALNLEAVYPDADTCAAAAFAIENKMEKTAICIPKPESSYEGEQLEMVLNKFMSIIKEFRSAD